VVVVLADVCTRARHLEAVKGLSVVGDAATHLQNAQRVGDAFIEIDATRVGSKHHASTMAYAAVAVNSSACATYSRPADNAYTSFPRYGC
jgi:hypothetical protein